MHHIWAGSCSCLAQNLVYSWNCLSTQTMQIRDSLGEWSVENYSAIKRRGHDFFIF
jgi:hypothetical protein